MDRLKEFDLLIIAEEEVKVEKTVDFLLALKKQPKTMLCLVNGRRKKDKDYLQLKVDSRLYQDYLCVHVRGNDLLKVHVYYFDNLITTVREFRTIKSCEFFP